VLARVFSEGTLETAAQVTAALKRYARLRRARVAQVQRAARQQGNIYHFGGPLALARDLAIKAMGPRRMLARQDWIYRWRM
jgi:salicylate hydroxylase